MPDASPPGLPFTKMQAVGNDFVVVDEGEWPARANWSGAAIRLCDRHFGIGADGFIVVGPSAVADARMQFFNPDGTPDMCGNGLRCVVKLVHERNGLSGERITRSWTADNHKGVAQTVPERIPASVEQFGLIETPVGLRRVNVEIGPSETGVIHTDMGTPQFAPPCLPMLLPDRADALNILLSLGGVRAVTVSVVNTGSTHAVLWVDELPSDALFFTVSPHIEYHPVFPQRTSVIWAKLYAAPGNLPYANRADIRIWERGVGETLGCGTGACAVAVAAAVEEKIQPHTWPVNPGAGYYSMQVRSRGGELEVGYRRPKPEYNASSEQGDPLTLTGRADFLFKGVWRGED